MELLSIAEVTKDPSVSLWPSVICMHGQRTQSTSCKATRVIVCVRSHTCFLICVQADKTPGLRRHY